MNFIHPTSIVAPNVIFGDNNFVGPFCLIYGPAFIGDNNVFEAYVSVGLPPQDNRFVNVEFEKFRLGLNPYNNSSSAIEIGNNNTFREFVTIHKPEFQQTSIGNDCFLMTHSHVSHDTELKNRVKLANGVQIGGFSRILEDSYLGLNATVHQFTVIGAGAMIGMNSTVNKDIYPYLTVAGNPAKKISTNHRKLSNIENLKWCDTYPFQLENLPTQIEAAVEDFKVTKNNTEILKEKYIEFLKFSQ